ncbi:hypothetical protein CR513_03788, partial [Mucuna pruriens]
MMPSTTYGMILSYGDFVMIKFFVGAFLMLRSIRSSTPGGGHYGSTWTARKYLITGSIDPPFSGTLIVSSPPAKNAKKLE